MKLLDSLQSDIFGSVPLSEVLLKAKALAYRLKYQEFKDWVEYEASGYFGKGVPEVPEYRTIEVASMGHFANTFRQIKNARIPLEVFPDKEMRDLIEHVTLRYGARELESLIESSSRSEHGWLQIEWPSGAAAYLSGRVYEGMVCISAWQVITPDALHHVLNTVRSRLLTFTLELVDRYPEAADLDFQGRSNNPSPEQVGYQFHYTILGDGHTFQSGKNTQHHVEVGTMNEVTMGDGNTIEGDFVVANSITQSFNRVTSSQLPDSVKDLFKQLATTAHEVSKVVSPETAQQVASDVETLTKEATAKEPRKQWIQLSGEGLVKAAKNVGAIGVPMLAVLDKLLPLLTG